MGLRAYHRVDPLMDERKSHYTPAQFGTFTKVQLMAGRTSSPGTFRSLEALRSAMPPAYAEHLDFLLAERDLIVNGRTGVVTVDGYREWQEGDLTVRERMARLRARKRDEAEEASVEGAEEEPHPSTGYGERYGQGDARVTPNVTDKSDETLRTSASHRAIRSSVGVSYRESVPKPETGSNGAAAEPLLTKAQLTAWQALEREEWQPFRRAWLARGLRLPPRGDADDETSQRALLWEIARDRPNDLGRWVSESPESTAVGITAHVLKRWHEVRDEARSDDVDFSR